MHKVKRWRFYCDHCKKSGCSSYHIAKHERGCCRNSNRVCGMCPRAELAQQPIDALIDALNDGGVAGVSALAEGCPACILAAIMQRRLRETGTLALPMLHEGETDPFYTDFEFKNAAKEFWDRVNEADRSWENCG